MSSTVAYLINQYPKVSHSFIRREIAAVEACGFKVARFSLRSCAAELVDKADLQELGRTRIVLDSGIGTLCRALFGVALSNPLRFWQALSLACKLGWRSDRGVLRHLAYLAEACVLLKWFAEAEVAHVHAHFGSNSTAVAALCRTLGGPPYSFTVHGPDEFDQAQAIGLEEKIKLATFVATVSSFSRSQLYRWCDQSQWSKIQIIRCGLDQDFLHPSPSAIPTEPRLVCIGRLCRAKGQLLLVEAVSQLVSQGVQLKLVLVGDGDLRSELEALIIRLGVQADIEITGWASALSVRHHLESARAMVLPSFAEGLPVVIMESLALGRPVVSTYIAGIPELVESGVSGWLVPSGSVKALATAIQEVLQAPVERLEQMGQAGAAQVARQHDASIEAGKLVELFQASLKQAQPSVPKISGGFAMQVYR